MVYWDVRVTKGRRCSWRGLVGRSNFRSAFRSYRGGLLALTFQSWIRSCRGPLLKSCLSFPLKSLSLLKGLLVGRRDTIMSWGRTGSGRVSSLTRWCHAWPWFADEVVCRIMMDLGWPKRDLIVSWLNWRRLKVAKRWQPSMYTLLLRNHLRTSIS